MNTFGNTEAGEIYGREILETQKKLAQLEEKSAHLSYLESTNQISADELSYKRSVFHMEKESLLAKQQYLKLKKEKYEGDYPNRLIQLPITRRAMEDVLKKGLSEIQVFPKNGKGNCVNLDLRLNTHSLRKMYGDHFYNTGIRLRENDILKVDMEMLKLLQDKFMHTNMSTTRHYNHREEDCFRTVCTHMNLGLEVLRNELLRNCQTFPNTSPLHTG